MFNSNFPPNVMSYAHVLTPAFISFYHILVFVLLRLRLGISLGLGIVLLRLSLGIRLDLGIVLLRLRLGIPGGESGDRSEVAGLDLGQACFGEARVLLFS